MVMKLPVIKVHQEVLVKPPTVGEVALDVFLKINRDTSCCTLQVYLMHKCKTNKNVMFYKMKKICVLNLVCDASSNGIKVLHNQVMSKISTSQS